MRRGLRIAMTGALGLLAGACAKGGDVPTEAEGTEKVACALGQGAQFAPVCALERAERGGERLYVVHHPDGGFRSFTVLANGAGLAAADGAETAKQSLSGDHLEVAVGEDRYRFPVKAKAAP